MYKKVYFIGIGGIGMSAVARYFKTLGLAVSGYDKTPSELCSQLENEGIPIHYEDRPDLIPTSVEDCLVVYTPAIPQDLKELVHVFNKGYRVIKRSKILGEIATGKSCLAVAGTHGKTTTSTLVAHIYQHSGIGCTAFLGGISKNYGSNLLVSKNDVIVAEADEFDRSFLQLYPRRALITAMDPDHLDIYGDIQTYQQAFKDFAAQVSKTLIIKYGLPITSQDTKAKILTYSFSDPRADYHAVGAYADPTGHFIYDLVCPDGSCIEGIRVGTIGRVNAENSLAAAALCLANGVYPKNIKDGIASYEGVVRRLDAHINTPTLSYIDDYAHHPEELESAISSLREVFPGRKLTAVFQPHLFSRTRDFADGFARALSAVDKLILLDIYPAREEPLPGVSSSLIFDKVTACQKVMLKKEELMSYLENEEIDVLLTFGAGNIDRFTGPVTEMLKKRLQ